MCWVPSSSQAVPCLASCWGYIERLQPGVAPPNHTTVEYLERIVNRVTDLRRGLDYLETRTDVDPGKVAFYGPSAGAQIGLILAAKSEPGIRPWR